MDIYKNQIRKLRNELHSNKKELKILDDKYNKIEKYKDIPLFSGAVSMCLALVVGIIGRAIPSFDNILMPIFCSLLLCTVIGIHIYSHLEKKLSINVKQGYALEENIDKLKDEIKNTHYFKLEKQRNKVIEEKDANTLETTQKQIELLNEYKSRINGIYDNQIPKEIDKEIEYLEKQSKIFKLSK